MISSKSAEKILRFVIAGCSTTILYFLLANVFAAVTPNPVLASTTAYVACVVASYLLQSRFTFRMPNDSRAQVAKFCAVSVVGLVVSVLVMKWAVDSQGLPYWVGALIVSGVIPVANFITFLVWVFVER